MKRFLVAGRLDGRHDAVTELQATVKERSPDGILFTGGIVEDAAAPLAEKLRSWEDFFESLGRLAVFSAVIPGPQDAPLQSFLHIAKGMEIDWPSVHVVHATPYEQRSIAIAGLGGDLTEDEDRLEGRLSSSRASAEYFLRTLWQSKKPRKVLLTSVPPRGRLGGEQGDGVCGDLIDSYHPSLCAVAGASEHRGFEWIAHTLVVNPGRLADGCMAWVDWRRSRDKQAELI